MNNKTILKSQQRFKSEAHNVYAEKGSKITVSSNDDRITSYPYGSGAGKVCKTEILSKVNMKLLTLIIIQMKIKQNII